MRRYLAALSVLTAVLGVTSVSQAAPAATAPTGDAGAYVALPSSTRIADGVSIGAHATKAIRIAGSHGVPASGVGAVAMTISVTQASQDGSLVAYAAGASAPDTVNVQFGPGRRTSDLAVVVPGTGGNASLHNNSGGAITVYVDVSGYYLGGPSGAVRSYHPVKATRLYDDIAIAAGKQANPVLGGHGPLPGASMGAVAITVTERSASKYGALGAKAYQLPISGVKMLRWKAGQRVSSFAIVPVDADGQLTLTNYSAAGVEVAIDVVGYFFEAGAPHQAGMFNGVPSATPLSNQSIGAGQSFDRLISGGSGVPLAGRNVRAVVLTLTASSTPSGSGSVLVYPQDTTRPATASVQIGTNETVSNTVLVPLHNSQLTLYNHSSGTVRVSLDVTGWVLDASTDVPAASTSRYLNDLTMSASTNASRMKSDGAIDAKADPKLVLLDIGAQSYRGPTLGIKNPGVAIALTDPTVRLNYPNLVSAINAYVAAFAGAGGTGTIAVGTNNSGNFTDRSDPKNPIYPAGTRGTDWANQVIEKISSPPGVTIVAADDIENGDPDNDGFDNSATRAKQWEAAYLSAHPANEDGTPDLIYNGSANGCPDNFGASSPTITCADGWTLGDFVALTHSGSRIGVLPQIYHTYMAVQWANIDRVSGNALRIVGSLTEESLAFSLPVEQGWAALYNGLATLSTTPSVPLAVDIEPAGGSAGLEARRAVA